MPDGERAPDISPLHRVSLRRNEASLVLLFVHKITRANTDIVFICFYVRLRRIKRGLWNISSNECGNK